MSNTDKLREIAHKYGGAIITGYGQSSASGFTEMFTAEEQCLSDLTALISEGYVTKEKYMDDLCDEYQRGFEDGMDEARNTDRL